ncbi:MAG: hypothetical protein ACU0AU_04970 [Cognatishimia activa]
MAFDTIRGERGQPRVKCICDVCGREEVVAAVHGKDGKDGLGSATNKIQNMGWTLLSKRLRCPTCEAKRKASKVVTKAPVKESTSIAPREPTKAQKREIISMLEEVYDSDAERYIGGDTDETVADVLSVMPGWVAAIREEFFGPAGSNEEIEQLIKDVKSYLVSARNSSTKLEKDLALVDASIETAEGYLARLESIEKAVGPRVIARAKL